MHLTSFRKNGGYLVFEVKVAGYVQIRGAVLAKSQDPCDFKECIVLAQLRRSKRWKKGIENDGGNVIGADIPSSSSIFSTLFPILPLPPQAFLGSI